MGMIVNGTKYNTPFINGTKYNAYLNGSKIWSTASPHIEAYGSPASFADNLAPYRCFNGGIVRGPYEVSTGQYRVQSLFTTVNYGISTYTATYTTVGGTPLVGPYVAAYAAPAVSRVVLLFYYATPSVVYIDIRAVSMGTPTAALLNNKVVSYTPGDPVVGMSTMGLQCSRPLIDDLNYSDVDWVLPIATELGTMQQWGFICGDFTQVNQGYLDVMPVSSTPPSGYWSSFGNYVVPFFYSAVFTDSNAAYSSVLISDGPTVALAIDQLGVPSSNMFGFGVQTGPAMDCIGISKYNATSIECLIASNSWHLTRYMSSPLSRYFDISLMRFSTSDYFPLGSGYPIPRYTDSRDFFTMVRGDGTTRSFSLGSPITTTGTFYWAYGISGEGCLILVNVSNMFVYDWVSSVPVSIPSSAIPSGWEVVSLRHPYSLGGFWNNNGSSSYKSGYVTFRTFGVVSNVGLQIYYIHIPETFFH